MPCNHKFQSDLNLEGLDFEPTTLLVGTFNPEWPNDNTAEWFYGRITGGVQDHNSGNHFWAVLPRLYGEESLKSIGSIQLWRSFCKRHKIAITDLISCIEDAEKGDSQHLNHLRGYSDKAIASQFKDYIYTNIILLLQQKPSIKNIYLTRGIGEAFWKKLWRPIETYCDGMIRCRTLITPSDYAFYQQGKYNKLYPEQPLNLEDFILMRWKTQWHNI